ncbi:MAG: MerR family transcriptional regulator [Bacteroidia bacterium]|mgnify:CR=1 FL=1|nr:MerR family transcriptional regulator [Bacteroidia bacterium]HQV00965.1 MerR family transcriptional regulator [Bacteroidia bacterium]
MPYKDKEIERLYYSISEVAKMFDVTISLLRYYDNTFEALSPAKNKKGNRLFTPEDVSYLRGIFYLTRQKGYTLESAKKMMADKSSTIKDEVNLLETLKSLRAFLTELKSQL